MFNYKMLHILVLGLIGTISAVTTASSQDVKEVKSGLKLLEGPGNDICSAAFIEAFRTQTNANTTANLQESARSYVCDKNENNWSLGIPLPKINETLSFGGESVSEACRSTSAFSNFAYSRQVAQSFLPPEVLSFLSGCFEGLKIIVTTKEPGLTELAVSYVGYNDDGSPAEGTVNVFNVENLLSCTPTLNQGDKISSRPTKINCKHQVDPGGGYQKGNVTISLRDRLGETVVLGGTETKQLNWNFVFPDPKKPQIYRCSLSTDNDPYFMVGASYNCGQEDTCRDPDAIRGLCEIRYGYQIRIGHLPQGQLFRTDWQVTARKKESATCTANLNGEKPHTFTFTGCGPSSCADPKNFSNDRIAGRCAIADPE